MLYLSQWSCSLKATRTERNESEERTKTRVFGALRASQGGIEPSTNPTLLDMHIMGTKKSVENTGIEKSKLGIDQPEDPNRFLECWANTMGPIVVNPQKCLPFLYFITQFVPRDHPSALLFPEELFDPVMVRPALSMPSPVLSARKLTFTTYSSPHPRREQR